MVRLRRGVPSIAAVVALVVGLTVVASAAGAAGHRGHSGQRPRIESPRGGALVTKATLKVRVAGSRRNFQALVGSRDVTRRFHRERGVWRATLRRGRDFELGANRLEVLAKGGIAARTFVATKPRKGLLKVRRLPAQVSSTALDIRGWTKRRIAQVRLTLNGRRVPRRLWPRELRSFDALLGADEGVRFGRNHLVVTAVSTDDRSQTVHRSFKVTRRAPLVGAGADRHTKPGRRVRLDGSSTEAPRKGASVSYRWRIVRAPKGSKAKLRHAESAHPSLTPDRRGRYVVRLVASDGHAGANPGAATASVAPPPTEPLPVETGETEPTKPTEAPTTPATPAQPAPAAETAPTSATDQTTVIAAPAIEPIGLPIQTIAPNGGIELGGKTYTTGSNWVQVLVLDRQTLEITQELGFNVDEASEFASKLAELRSQSPGRLVILSGGGRGFYNEKTGESTGGWGTANETAIESALSLIGGGFDQPADLPGNFGILDTGGWSAIGVLGTARGSATQDWGMSTGGGGKRGSLHGYLQMDHYGNYGFVSPEVVGINTNVTATEEGSNEIQVGEKTYSSANLAPGWSGFQVLVLDSELDLVKNETFTTNPPGGDPDTGQVVAMRNLLDTYQLLEPRLPADLIVVQSIGTPGGYDKNWLDDREPSNNNPSTWGETLAGAIGSIGGPAAHDQFAELIGSAYVQGEPAVQGFTMVASTGLVEPFEEAATATKTGQDLPVSGLAGVLVRNRDSRWQMQTPTASPTKSGDGFQAGLLTKLAYGPETPFPMNTGPYLAASEWIAEALGLSPAPDVRTAYYENDEVKWNSLALQVRDLKCPSGKGFTTGQCEALEAQLATEFPMVAEVWGMVGSWEKLFTDTTGPDYIDLQKISGEILAEIEKYRQSIVDEARLSVAGVYEAFAIGAQSLLAVSGAEDVEPAIGAVAAGFGTVGGFSVNREGAASTAPVDLPTSQVAQEMVARYTDMAENLSRIAAIFVSDWGKLQQASKLSNGFWSLDSTAAAKLQEALERASEATDYTSLLPAAFGEYVLQAGPSELNSAPWEHPWNYRCQEENGGGRLEPFEETFENRGSYVIGARTFGNIGKVEEGKPLPEENTIRQVRVISTELEGHEPEWGIKHRPEVLPQSIGDKLFASITSGNGLGMDQFRFFANPAFKRWGLECKDGQR